MNLKPVQKLFVLFLSLIAVSCGSSENLFEYNPAGETNLYYDIDAAITEDEEMKAYIAPYIRDMAGIMDRPLTMSEGLFERSVPEGSLGNLVADIVRYRATTEMQETVHVSVINNGGLRGSLPEGELTVGHIYYLMPFDYSIVLLRFSGDQLKQIAMDLAAANGEPVSGIRFRMIDGKARDILVDSRNVDPDRNYWVATNHWMADGGGNIPTLWEPVERRNLDVLIRDALIEYLRGMESIYPYVDQRVRN